MNRPVRCAVPVLLAIGLWQAGAIAQPAAPTSPASPQYSVTELERFLGGRTLISVDLKDATLEEVAAALSQASRQKITVPRSAPLGLRPTITMGSAAPLMSAPALEAPTVLTPPPNLAPAGVAPPAPLYTLFTAKMPFWEALRGWQLAARRDAEAANKLAPKPFFLGSNVPNSLGVRKDPAGFLLQPSNTLADGRAVAAWPYLVVATDLRRVQEANLSETGLREIESSNIPPFFQPARTTAVALAPPPQAPIPEEKRWSDHLVLTATGFADPKLAPSGLRCEIVEAIDDKGNDLRLPATDNPRTNYGGSYRDSGAGAPLQIHLASKPNMGKRLVRLRGVLRFRVVTRFKHWETTQLQTPVEDTIQEAGGEFKVQFKGVKPKGTGWTADFGAESRGAHLERFWNERIQTRGSAQDGSWRGVLNFQGVSSMRLVDENGREFEVGSPPSQRDGTGIFKMFSMGDMSLSRQAPDGTTAPTSPTSLDVSPLPLDVAENWTYRESHGFDFRPPSDAAANGGAAMGRPVKLIVDFPVERREISVPFEFTDLPLPPS